MSVRAAFETSLFVLVVLLTLSFLFLVGVKAWRQVRERRHAVLVAEIRPIVVRALDEDTEIDFVGRRGAVAEQLAASMLPKLRGADRDRLAELLEEGGVLGRSRRGLASSSAARRQRSAELLGAAGDRRASRDLERRLHDRDDRVRLTAARALGRIGDPSTVPALLAALDDRRISGHSASMALLRIGEPGIPGLTHGLRSREAQTRRTAVAILGALGATSTGERVVELLDDADHGVRCAAAIALGRLGLPGSVPILIHRLEAEFAVPAEEMDLDAAVAYADALGRIGHRSAIPVLEEALMRRHRLSHVAGAALAEMGERRSRRSIRERQADRAAVVTVEGVS